MVEPTDDFERRRALDAAIEARLVTPCPLHPDVLLRMGEPEDVKIPAPQPDLGEVLRDLPTYCPKCADRDD